MNIDFDV